MTGWVGLLVAASGLLWLMLTVPAALDRRRARKRARLPCRCCRDGYPVCWLGVFERLEADLCARHLARWVHIAQLEREVLDRPEEAESRAREWQPGWPPTPPKGPGGGSHQHTYPRGRGVGGQCTICGRNSWEGS